MSTAKKTTKKVAGTKKAATKKVVKKVKVAEAKAVSTNQTMPKFCKLRQPNNGEVAVLGEELPIGRRKYGGDFFGRLNTDNYTLCTDFVNTLEKANIKDFVIEVTPGKVCGMYPNSNGTLQTVFALEANKHGVKFNQRYMGQKQLDICNKAKATVFGHRTKGTTINGVEVTKDAKAHSHHIALTTITAETCLKLTKSFIEGIQ